jgi:hypothetical protein
VRGEGGEASFSCPMRSNLSHGVLLSTAGKGQELLGCGGLLAALGDPAAYR